MLTDDNFCSIVNAVEKGRAIYSGIQKFVAFIMSVHIAEAFKKPFKPFRSKMASRSWPFKWDFRQDFESDFQ